MISKRKINIKIITSLLKGIWKYNFLRHFLALTPTELQINITYKCNSRCEMCNIWQKKLNNELTYNQWEKIMKDPIFVGIERLIIAGGEPTIAPDFDNLIKLFINTMPRLNKVNFLTNGLVKEKTVAMVKTLLTASKKRDIEISVSVSLDGVGKTHESMRQIPNAFAKTAQTIEALRKLTKQHYNLWLGVSCVVCHKNLFQVGKLKEWCHKKEIPFNMQLVGFHESYVNNLDKQKELDFLANDKSYLLKLIKRQKLTHQKSWTDVMAYYWHDMFSMYWKNTTRSSPCPFLIDAFCLDSLGDVYYCLSERKIGNCLNGNTVSKLYYDAENLSFRQQLAKNSCLKCNSGCLVCSAIRKDFKKYLWFLIREKILKI